MNNSSTSLLQENDSTQLKYFGERFFCAVYDARCNPKWIQGICKDFEKEFALKCLSLFEFFLRKRVLDADLTCSIEKLVHSIEQAITHGIDNGSDLYYASLSKQVSASFQDIIEQSIFQTTVQVNASVFRILSVMSAKWWDAALAYMERVYGDKIAQILRDLHNETTRADTAIEWKKSIHSLLQDAIRRFRKNNVSIQEQLLSLRTELSEVSSENISLKTNLQERIVLLEAAQKNAQKFQNWWQKLVPIETGYRAIEKVMSPLKLPGKTLSEQVANLSHEAQALRVNEKKWSERVRENLSLNRRIEELVSMNSQLEMALALERDWRNQAIYERTDYIEANLKDSIAWFFWALLEEFRNGEYLDVKRRAFENMFFQFRAGNPDVIDICIGEIEKIKQNWKRDFKNMQLYLRPHALIPDGLLRTNIERTAIEFVEIVYQIGIPKGMQEKIRSYERISWFEKGNVIDVA